MRGVEHMGQMPCSVMINCFFNFVKTNVIIIVLKSKMYVSLSLTRHISWMLGPCPWRVHPTAQVWVSQACSGRNKAAFVGGKHCLTKSSEQQRWYFKFILKHL